MATNRRLLMGTVARLIAGAPLLLFGAMHLSGAMPVRPLMEAAGVPMPGVLSVVAPTMQVIAGILLLSGFWARGGALLALGAMAGAVVTHLRIPDDRWPDLERIAQDPGAVTDESSMMLILAAVICLGALWVLVRGPGAWAVRCGCDRRGSNRNQEPGA